MTMKESQLLSRPQAAAYLGVSVSTLARWACCRTGPAFYRVGRAVRYRISELDAYVTGGLVIPVREAR